MRYPFSKLLALPLLIITAHGLVANRAASLVGKNVRSAAGAVTNPAIKTTDTAAIMAAVRAVKPKTSLGSSTSEITVVNLDGRVVDLSLSSVTGGDVGSRKRALEKRVEEDGYSQLWFGSGTGPTDRDAAIQGPSLLTSTVVPNATYNIDACLTFCNTVEGCIFANLYYEFNNPTLDQLHSNLECAVFSDIGGDKTDTGGQQLYPPPIGPTFIQDSTGWVSNTVWEPPIPQDYELVFDSLGSANEAPGYMGFALIDKYDVNACAALCDTRKPDPVGGACEYFNVWRALVNGLPTTNTCAFYYLPTDAFTAMNHGQGDLQVEFSRGYSRTSVTSNTVVDQ